MPTFTNDQWLEVSPYLDDVLSLPENDREAWITNLRSQRPTVAFLLEELLQEHAALNNGAFLAGQPVGSFQASSAGQTIGAYRLISAIGEGGMGTIWLAERSDGRFERKVAIKFLRLALGSQSGTERFKREGRILAQLSHSHIV